MAPEICRCHIKEKSNRIFDGLLTENSMSQATYFQSFQSTTLFFKHTFYLLYQPKQINIYIKNGRII